MKFLIVIFALIGFAFAAQLPDSATQGPNPQDIATPEPEYIDIDEPLPAPAPAPVAQPRASFAAPAPRPVISAAPSQAYLAPQRSYHPAPAPAALPGHTFSSHSGYQYRRPVYVRRVYRRRRY